MKQNLVKNYILLKLKIGKPIKENIDLFLLAIYFFSLPIAHVASIQSISLALFIAVFFIKEYKDMPFKTILNYTNIVSIFFILLSLSFLSLYYTPDIQESFKEIRSELIKNFIVMAIFYLYIVKNDAKKVSYILYIILTVLVTHTILNIIVWIHNGGWPVRTGAFLDGTIIGVRNQAGERFGIWATYALSMGLAFSLSRYRLYSIPFVILTFISIIANNTRATFISFMLILFVYFFYLYKSKKIKYAISLSMIVILSGFFIYSQNLSTRFNAYKVINSIKHLGKYSPSQYKTLETEHGLGHSATSRLAMWDSIILYRIKEPFVPKGYGRFLYKRSIKDTWKNNPKNIPYIIYAQAHNEYLGILYSLGIVGLMAFLYLLYFKIKISYKILKYSKNSTFKIFSTFIFLGTVGFMVSLMFGSFFGDSEAKFFYPLYGILLGIYFKEKKYEKHKLN